MRAANYWRRFSAHFLVAWLLLSPTGFVGAAIHPSFDAGQDIKLQTTGDLTLLAAYSPSRETTQRTTQTRKKLETLNFELEQNRVLLSTLTAGNRIDLQVGGNVAAQIGTKDADGNLQADRMTLGGVIKGSDRQQVSLTHTDDKKGTTLNGPTSKVLGNLAAQGIRSGAADSLTPEAMQTGQAAIAALMQSGLLNVKNQPGIQAALNAPTPNGAALTYTDTGGKVSLTLAGQAKVQAVYSQLRLTETFDVKHFADQGTAQAVTLVAAIALTVCTGGAGAGTLGAALATAGSTSAMMINAAIIGMSSTMVGQLAGGASFDQAFAAGVKAGATSAFTAGVASGIDQYVNGSTSATPTTLQSGTQTVQSGTNAASTGLYNLDRLSTSAYWQQTALNAVAKGAISQATGGSFKDGAVGSVVGSLAATGAGAIGDLTPGAPLTNIIAHAVLGCAVASASGKDCGSGALGGAGSATLARLIDSAISDSDLSKTTRDVLIASGSVAGSMAIAGALGKDVLTAGNAAGNEVLNNYLTHNQIQSKQAELKQATTDEQRQQIEQKYAMLDKQQQEAADDCLLKDSCSSVMQNKEVYKTVLADLNASCAPPRLCGADAQSSINQLNILLDKAEAIKPVYPLESVAALSATGGLGASAGGVSGVSTATRAASFVIGGTTNYALQDGKQPTDWTDVTMAAFTNYLGVGRGLAPSMVINASGALIGSTLKGEDPYPGMVGALVGTVAGYGVGKTLEIPLNSKLNPWYRPDWIRLPLEVSAWNTPSVVPSIVGNVGSSMTQEKMGNATKNTISTQSK